jgi:membrane protein implicated in regulation of membrane protease activity
MTPTATSSPTPDYYVVWTMPPRDGTPAGQAVALVYQVTAGSAAIALVLFAILTSLLIMFVLILLKESK